MSLCGSDVDGGRETGPVGAGIVPTIELRPGYHMSTLIKGGWPAEADHRLARGAAALADMAAFIDKGITTFDGSGIDASTEVLVGACIDDLRRGRGRDAVRKIGFHTAFKPDVEAAAAPDQREVEAAVDRSLTRLGIEQLDLVQLQWPDYAIAGSLDVLGHLCLLQAKGKVRHIGLANVDLEHLRMFVRAGFGIVSVKVPFSLIDQRPAGAFADFCHEHDIAILASGVLAGGFLSEQWLGAADPGLDLPHPESRAHRLAIEDFGGWALFQELLLVLQLIATRHRVNVQQVALRAMDDHPDPAALILEMRSASRLASRLRGLEFKPTERDREALAEILRRRNGPRVSTLGVEQQRIRDGERGSKNDLHASHG